MQKGHLRDRATIGLEARSRAGSGLRVRGRYVVEGFERPGGKRLWRVAADNLIVNTGLDDIVATGLNSAIRYLGLKAAGAPAASDTMASHATWTEITAYSEATRPEWVDAAAGSGQRTNTASKATYTINATTTIFGCFLTTNNTKGGTTGTLVSAVNFAASQAAQAGNIVNVTYQITISDDGV